MIHKHLQYKQRVKSARAGGARNRRGPVWRIIGVGAHVVVWAALLSVVAQLLYPPDRTLPNTKVDGRSVSMFTKNQLLTRLDDMATDAEVKVVTPAKARTIPWTEMGVTVDRLATADAVLDYRLWERLVPFSSMVRAVKSNYSPLVIIDQERLRAFIDTIVENDQREVKEASVTFNGGEIQVNPAKAGFGFERASLKQQLLATPFADGAALELKPKTLPVTHNKKEVAAVAAQARNLLRQEVTLTFNGQTITPERKAVGKWLAVKEDKQTKKLELAVDRSQLKKYLDKISEKYASPPDPVRVTLLDGQEIRRTSSEPGLAMDVDQAAAALTELLFDGVPGVAVSLPTVPVAPDVIYHRTYSKTSAGLQALIEYWEQTTYGNYGIVVREIGGKNRYAEFGADKRMVTASTYKMFLAYAVYMQIEQGNLSSRQMTDIGWSVQDCITEMIVNSTNPCAISLHDLVGWKKVDRILHEEGFNNTYLNNKNNGDKYTTVRNEADFLLRLYGGSLLNKQHTQELLGMMKRQIWRGGIPAGVPAETIVADKVGFYGGWVHDVAIVYGPKSTYILAVMSRGGSDPVFAQLSSQVYNFFAR